jgi:hypothetical protein
MAPWATVSSASTSPTCAPYGVAGDRSQAEAVIPQVGDAVMAGVGQELGKLPDAARFDSYYTGLSSRAARVRRVLARIAVDLDALARQGLDSQPEKPVESADSRTRHRRRLAEPEEKLRGRTAKEQRDALRHAFGLPPYRGDGAESFRQTHGTNT